MAHDGSRSAGKNCRQPAGELRLDRPKPIDAPVNRLQATDLQPVLDVGIRQSQPDQLVSADDAVLTLGKLVNRPVKPARGAFPLTINGNAPRTIEAVRITLRSLPSFIPDRHKRRRYNRYASLRSQINFSPRSVSRSSTSSTCSQNGVIAAA